MLGSYIHEICISCVYMYTYHHLYMHTLHINRKVWYRTITCITYEQTCVALCTYVYEHKLVCKCGFEGAKGVYIHEWRHTWMKTYMNEDIHEWRHTWMKTYMNEDACSKGMVAWIHEDKYTSSNGIFTTYISFHAHMQARYMQYIFKHTCLILLTTRWPDPETNATIPARKMAQKAAPNEAVAAANVALRLCL